MKGKRGNERKKIVDPKFPQTRKIRDVPLPPQGEVRSLSEQHKKTHLKKGVTSSQIDNNERAVCAFSAKFKTCEQPSCSLQQRKKTERCQKATRSRHHGSTFFWHKHRASVNVYHNLRSLSLLNSVRFNCLITSS